MKMCIVARDKTCQSAVTAYVQHLASSAGLPVSIERMERMDDGTSMEDALIEVQWSTESDDDSAGYEDGEECNDDSTIAMGTATHYQRNLAFLGSNAPFAGAWLKGHAS